MTTAKGGVKFEFPKLNAPPFASKKRLPRHNYSKLSIHCFEPRYFHGAELRAAVEYLKTVPGADDPEKWLGIEAQTVVRAGDLQLRARSFLKLHQIRGKTPAEVWSLFDASVDKQIDSLIAHQSGGFRP